METIDKMPNMAIAYANGTTPLKDEERYKYWLDKVCNKHSDSNDE